MIACVSHHASFFPEGKGDKKMEEYHKDSPQASTCLPLNPLQPSMKAADETKYEKHVSLSESAKSRCDRENHLIPWTNADNKGIQDLEAAKAAVVFMGIPEVLVQLVIDIEPLDPSYKFTNVEQLYQLACDLDNNPERHADLQMKLNKHELKKQEESGGLNAKSNAEGGRQKLPAGMSEGSRQSATAEECSGAAKGCTSLPTTVQAARSEDCYKQMCGSTASAQRGKTGKASVDVFPAEMQVKPSTTSLTTSAKHREDNVDDSVEEAKISFGTTEQPKSDVPEKSSKELLRERVKKLAAENWRLTQRKMCRACKQVELASSGVTFLPCGHFITCEACCDTFDDCPACGKVIMGTVRTFLS